MTTMMFTSSITRNSSTQPFSELVGKAEEIHCILSDPKVDVWKLRELSLTPGGLVDDAIRKKAWPILVGIDDASISPKSSSAAHTYAHPRRSRGRTGSSSTAASLGAHPSLHKDEDNLTVTSSTSTSAVSTASQITAITSYTTNTASPLSTTLPPPPPPVCLDAAQVARDVARCTWHLLTGSQRVQRLQMEHKRKKKVARHIRKKQDKLQRLICDTLVASYGTPQPLRYYQGYHDVACIILSALQDMKLSSRVLLQISYSHLRDCCNPDFESLQVVLNLTVLPLLHFLDPVLYQALHQVDMTPYFCLSWILTWFAHDVRDTALVKRLFDAFLASHAMLPTYLSIAMLIRNRREILECESDFSLLHQVLCGLPKNSSQLGWKYRPGEGYVTDEEHGGTTVSTTSSMGTADFLMVAAAEEADHNNLLTHHHGAAPTTLLSSISSLEEPSVSFDSLIHDSLEIMRRIPPSFLVSLREHVRQSEKWISFQRIRPLASSLPSLVPRMLQKPPFWAVRMHSNRSLVDVDAWLSKQQRSGKRRSRSHSQASAASTCPHSAVTLEEKMEVEVYLEENKDAMGVIAAGYGPGLLSSGSNRIVGHVGAAILSVVVVSLAIGFAYFQQQRRQSTLWDVDFLNGQAMESPPLQMNMPGEIIATSTYRTSFDCIREITPRNDFGLEDHCPRCTDNVEPLISFSVDLPVGLELEMISLQPLTALALISHSDRHLLMISDYQALLLAIHRLVRKETIFVRQFAVLVYSYSKSNLLDTFKTLHAKLTHQFHLMKFRLLEIAIVQRACLSYHQMKILVRKIIARTEPHARKVSLRMNKSFMVAISIWNQHDLKFMQFFGMISRYAGSVNRHVQIAALRSIRLIGTSEFGRHFVRAVRVLAANPLSPKVVEKILNVLFDGSSVRVNE